MKKTARLFLVVCLCLSFCFSCFVCFCLIGFVFDSYISQYKEVRLNLVNTALINIYKYGSRPVWAHIFLISNWSLLLSIVPWQQMTSWQIKQCLAAHFRRQLSLSLFFLCRHGNICLTQHFANNSFCFGTLDTKELWHWFSFILGTPFAFYSIILNFF